MSSRKESKATVYSIIWRSRAHLIHSNAINYLIEEVNLKGVHPHCLTSSLFTRWVAAFEQELVSSVFPTKIVLGKLFSLTIY